MESAATPARKVQPVYAIVRVNSWDEEKLAAGAQDIAEFDRIHSEQPGFLGTLAVDIGEGRQAIVNLWESEELATSALPTMGRAVQRLVAPLLTQPSQLIGTGEVVGGSELLECPSR